MSEHRVPMLGGAWRRMEDPARSRDPRVRAVVSALGTLPAPQLRAEFRDELRAQLVAITPRIVAEAAETEAMVDIVPRSTAAPAPARAPGRRPSPGPTVVVAAPTRTHHVPGVLDRLRRVHLGRPLAIVASVVTVFALLLGGAVWMSRKALPGDSLYGLKRASERFELATAGSDSERASDYLSFAASRVQEVRALLSRDDTAAGSGLTAAGISAGTASLVTSTLASADSDVRSASVILTGQAAKSGSASPLQTMLDWTPAQLNRLKAVSQSLPSGALQNRVQSSAGLVAAAQARAQDLKSHLGCSCLSSATTDSLGVVPCDVCSAPASPPSVPGSVVPTVGGTGRSTAPGAPASGAGAATTPNAGGGSTGAASSSAPPPSGGASSSTGGGILPSLPIHLPTSVLPIKPSSCGIAASLGPIGIGIGLCPISVGINLHP